MKLKINTGTNIWKKIISFHKMFKYFRYAIKFFHYVDICVDGVAFQDVQNRQEPIGYHSSMINYFIIDTNILIGKLFNRLKILFYYISII